MGLILVGIGALLVLVAMLTVAQAAIRRRRERRWLRERVAVAPAASYVQLSDAPRGPSPGLEVDLEIRREAPRWTAAEVADGHR